jgi:hypothetical protein
MKREDDWAVDRFRTQLGVVYFAKYAAAALTAWAFLFGTAVFVLRGRLGFDALDLLWGLASLPVALIPAVVLTARRLPTPAAVRALLDRHARCGGLLMAAQTHATESWHDAMPPVEVPGVRWKFGPSLGMVSVGLAFLLLAFLVPQGFANRDENGLDVSREVERLDRQLEILQQEKVLDPARAADLKEKLEQVRRAAKGRDPVKTLEALDHLHDLVAKAAKQASESAGRKMEELGRAEAMAMALDRMGLKLDPAQLAEAMNELAQLAKRAATEKELMEAGLDQETLDALKAGKLTKEQMKKLAKALGKGKELTKEQVGRLVKAKVLDAAALEKCDKAGKCDCAGLAAYLKENGSKSDLADAIALIEDEGNGGTADGPGKSKLTFGDEDNDEGFKFKEEALPESDLKAIKDSQVSGISKALPQIGKEKPGEAASGALKGAKAGGGSANTQVVLPRHRGAVERYFDRADMPKK